MKKLYILSVIRLSGYPVIRLSDYPVTRLSGYPVIRLSATLDFYHAKGIYLLHFFALIDMFMRKGIHFFQPGFPQLSFYWSSEVWHESAEIYEDPSMFSKIYRYFWRFSTTGKAASKLHLGVSMQVVIHTKFAFSRLEQYGYCYN